MAPFLFMKVKSKKLFSSVVLGNVVEGQILDVSEERAKQLINDGFVESIEPTAEAKPKPKRKKKAD